MYKILSYSQEHYQFVADDATDLDRIVAKGKPWAAIGATCYVIADGTTYILDSDMVWHPLVTSSGGGGEGSPTDAIRYNTTQNLSEAQQARAQANIGITKATEDSTGVVKGGKTTDILDDGSIEVVSMSIADLTQDENEEVVFSAGGAASWPWSESNGNN